MQQISVHWFISFPSCPCILSIPVKCLSTFWVSYCMTVCNVIKWLGPDTQYPPFNSPFHFPNTHPHPTVLLASSTDTFTSHLPSVFRSLWLPNKLWLFIFEFGVLLFLLWVSFISWTAVGTLAHGWAWLNTHVPFAGEICGFRIHGQNVPFEAVVLDKSTGEGVIRAKDKLDCELQKEHTFTIQAYDCGEGPDGSNMKKSHKCVSCLGVLLIK